MTIRKGADWGKPEAVPGDAIFVSNDAEANEAISPGLDESADQRRRCA